MSYGNTPIKLPLIRDRSFQSPERPFNNLNSLVSPVQNKHKHFDFGGNPQNNYPMALGRQPSEPNRSMLGDGPSPLGGNLNKVSSFANKIVRIPSDSNLLGNSYNPGLQNKGQKSPLAMLSNQKSTFSSLIRENPFASETSFHHNPPKFNGSINLDVTPKRNRMDPQQHQMYINPDSNLSFVDKKQGLKSFSSKILKGITQGPGPKFNVNQHDTDSSFAHHENVNNSSFRMPPKFKSSSNLPYSQDLSQSINYEGIHPSFQLPLIQKSPFGFNQATQHPNTLSSDRSHRRIISLPSDQIIANALNGSLLARQTSNITSPSYQTVNDLTKDKVSPKNIKPLPTEQLIGLPLYQEQNSARVNGHENDMDYLKYLMAQGSNSQNTTPKHSLESQFLNKEKKKKKKKEKEKVKEKPKVIEEPVILPPKEEEKPKEPPKEKKVKKVVIRENHRQLERDREMAKRERVQGLLRVKLWVLVFPRMLKNRIMDFVDTKRLGIDKVAKQNIKDIVNAVSGFIKKNCFTYLQLLYDKKQSLNIVPCDKKSKKDLNKKTIEQRAKLISTSLLSILTSVMNATINSEIPMEVIEFFASVTENLNVMPTGFLFPFEINRLEFTQFLTLKNMNPMRSKMMIGMFFLIRMLVFYFMTQPWAAKVKVQETPLLLENLKICSSVLYHVIFNFFRKRLPIVKNNQEAASESEKKLKPRNGLLFAFGETERPEGTVSEDDVIIGLFSRGTLNDYFLLEKAAVEDMNDIIEQWLDMVYTKVQVHQVCLEKPAGKQKGIF